jgi:hypothetical protein
MPVSPPILRHTASTMGGGNVRLMRNRSPITHGTDNARYESCRPSSPQGTNQHREKLQLEGLGSRSNVLRTVTEVLRRPDRFQECGQQRRLHATVFQ